LWKSQVREASREQPQDGLKGQPVVWVAEFSISRALGN
jgi:hypothetical protein